MQPIRFKPLLKQTLWGGDKLIPFKRLEASLDHVGESWELSGVTGSESIALTPPYEGLSLNALVALLKDRLVGRHNYERFGDEFPLLIKFIDAQQDLSIQVHPSDKTAAMQGLKRGKTEMWYVLSAEPGAMLYCGLKRAITPEEYRSAVANDTICDALARYPVTEGDVFFIPAGRIHAIGKGCLIAEIQQTSDVTYRIYDFKRRDKDGRYRQLHTEQAAQSIDYSVLADYRTHYCHQPNSGTELVSCPYFTTHLYDIDRAITLSPASTDSFLILIMLRGSAQLTADGGNRMPLRAGETVLVPAAVSHLLVEGNARFLTSYI